MKIIYLHQYFNTPSMSGGTRSYEMGRRLLARGHSVVIITTWRESDGKKGWFETYEDGIRVFWLPVKYSNNMSFLGRLVAFLHFSVFASFKALSIKGDVVLATSTPLTIIIPGLLFKWVQKIPLVFEVRDLWPELPIAMGFLDNPIYRFLARKLELIAYKNASSIIALSPGMKEGVVRRGYDSKQIAVIPNASDVDLFKLDKSYGDAFRRSRDFSLNKPLLVYTGTLGIINDVGYLVDLAVELMLMNSDVMILIIGGGAEFESIREKAKNKGVLYRNLQIETRLPKSEIPNVLAAADICSVLFKDIKEMQSNSANKFFDALAAGKPVFINYGGWMNDLVAKSGCGITAWGKTINEVALELHTKLIDDSWIKKTSAASAVLASEVFSRDVLAESFSKVIEETVNGSADNASSIAPGCY